MAQGHLAYLAIMALTCVVDAGVHYLQKGKPRFPFLAPEG